ADDLFCLRNRDLETEPGHWVVNAGLPAYVALFGRDILTASWQGAMVGAEFARGALEIVARTQATEDSVWRDAEPGKLIHEAHRGPPRAAPRPEPRRAPPPPGPHAAPRPPRRPPPAAARPPPPVLVPPRPALAAWPPAPWLLQRAPLLAPR